MSKKLNIGIIGLGLIGLKRIESFLDCKKSNLLIVCDSDKKKAIEVSKKFNCLHTTSWIDIVEDASIDIIIVSTPNYLLFPISKKALTNNKHTLIEKPMGCNLKEAEEISHIAKKTKSVFKVGFNHRYHPAIIDAYKLFKKGTIGKIINIRANYGHGGRPGYEKEWRGKKTLSGGGELTDQGVHLTDLINLFCGKPCEAFCLTQTAIWPIKPLEDNAFSLFNFKDNTVASFHTSWTQWKNNFTFEIFGEYGSLSIRGLGGSYGLESLTKYIRRKKGGMPFKHKKIYEGSDLSWKREWIDFINACNGSRSDIFSSENEGLVSMIMLDALYRSNKKKSLVKL